MLRNSCLLLVLLSIVLWINMSVYGQSQQNDGSNNNEDDDSVATISIDTEAVSFDLGVRDSKGQVLVKLNANDFSLYEDGQPQEISHFTKINTPINLVMVLDASSSVKPHKDIVRLAVYDFITKLNPKDKVALLQFKAKSMLLSDFSNNHEELRTALDLFGVSVIESVEEVLFPVSSPEGSAVYDAIASAIKLLDKTSGRKAIIVFSDWMDSHSFLSFDLIKSKLEQSNASLYVIKLENQQEMEAYIRQGGGFTTKQFHKYLRQVYCKDCVKKDPSEKPCDSCLDSMNQLSVEKLCEINRALYKIAQEETSLLVSQLGGRIFSVKSMEDLTSQYSALLDELHTLYSIAYYPEGNSQTAKWHSLQVKTKLPNVVLSYRKGYTEKNR